MPSEHAAANFFESPLAAETPRQVDSSGDQQVRELGSTARASRQSWPIAVACLIGGDALVTMVAGLVGYGSGHGIVTLSLPLIASCVLAVMTLVGLGDRGLYTRSAVCSRDVPVREIVMGLLQGVGVFAVMCVVLGRALSGEFSPSHAELWRQIDMMITLPWMAITFGAALAGMMAWRFTWQFVRGDLALHAAKRVVVVGNPDRGSPILAQLRDRPGVDVVGIIDPAADGSRNSVDGVKIYSSVDQLKDLVKHSHVETALIADDSLTPGTVQAVLNQAQVTTLDVVVAPTLDVGGAVSPLARFAGMPVIEVRRRPLSARGALLKRSEDILIASCALVLMLPVLVAVAVMIKLDSNGPVFFRQPRVGLNGRVFRMFKFRSMYHNLTDHGAAQQTLRRDPRVTRVGAVLRRHSLDELPQILNVLRGDMSIVGPRPHALAMTAAGIPLEEACKDYPARFRVKPGITGWAQVNGWRGNVDTVQKLLGRVKCDLYYIDNWSLWLDIRIIFKTAACVLSDEAAF